jgi:hypothetical protein
LDARRQLILEEANAVGTAYLQWGDAENAIKGWSKLAADRLYAYTSGAAKP